MSTTQRATIVALLGLATACTDGGVGTIPPDWHLTSFASTHLEATPGEQVVLSWVYSTDEQVVSQRMCFLYPNFNGVGEECFDLDPADREVDFNHVVAFTAYLTAETEFQDTSGALQVRDRQEAFMRATWSGSDPERPRLGQTTTMEFSQFVALYDDDRDHLVDGLKDLFPVEPWRFFRARTASPYEGGGGTYSYYQGAAFPLLTPYPDPFDDLPDYANVVVHGGGIVITGGEDQGTFKPTNDDGEGTFVVGDDLEFDRVFLQLSYLWGETAGIITPSDIEVGNLEQGLVLGITSVATTLGFTGNPHDVFIFFDEIGNPHTSGSVKGASVSNFITPVGGDATNVSVQLDAIDWRMPLFNDEELGGSSLFDLLPTEETGP